MDNNFVEFGDGGFVYNVDETDTRDFSSMLPGMTDTEYFDLRGLEVTE